MNARRLLALGAATLAVAGVAAGCGSSSSSDGGSTGGNADLSGAIAIDGSSTVAPLSIGAAEAFNDKNPNVDIKVGTSGTGGGFEKFCAGQTDISDASRAIKDEEKAACQKGGVAYTELRVASDGITVVVKKGADLGKQCVSFDELKAAWAKGSRVANWQELGAGWKSVPMKLAGPGDQSGTYDFFNEEVLGKDAKGEVNAPRADYAASEDDNVIVTAVEGADGTMGYFGFTYYEENMEKLDALQVKGDGDCVAPSAEAITSGDYPLSRPLFIYVKNSSLATPHVKAFVKYYIENATKLAEDNQFVPAPQDSLDADLAKIPA